MAFQQQGGINGGAAGGPDHHPQGTEYTLQGQLSWSWRAEEMRMELSWVMHVVSTLMLT